MKADEIFNAISEILGNNRCNSAQVLVRSVTHNGHRYLVAHVTCLDTVQKREKVIRLITDGLGEVTYPIQAGKTFVDYVLMEREVAR